MGRQFTETRKDEQEAYKNKHNWSCNERDTRK